MIIKRNVFCFCVVIMLIFLLSWTITAARLEVEVDKKNLEPGEEINVLIKLLDDDGELLKEDRRILARVDRGGLLNLANFKKGIMLKEGQAEFTYVAPEDTGSARIKLLDLQAKISTEVNFEIKTSETDREWKKEFASLKELRGRVFVRYSDEKYWDGARDSQRVYQGDGVKTLVNSWVTLNLFDGSEVELEPRTELVIQSLGSLKEDSKVKQGIFELVKGNVLCSAKEFINKGSRFSIETESAAAGVRGTYFEVRYGSNGEMEVLVYRGSVRMTHRATGQVFVVKKGQKLTMPAGEEMPEVEDHGVTEEERKEKVKKQKDRIKAKEEKDNDNKDKDKSDKDNGDNDSGDNSGDSGGGNITITPIWEGNVDIEPEWETGNGV